MHLKKPGLFIITSLFFICASAQDNSMQKKELQAVRIIKAPVIDGKLNEEEWKDAPVAKDFTQFQFNWNKPSAYKTEVKILYDDVAIYIGAYMYDPNPDSIMRELSRRDNLGSSDFFGFNFDCFQDGLNAVEFLVTSKNVQLDAKMYPDVGEDFSWDAVWVSETKINTDGWCAEIKIPYSAIRFPNVDLQTWRVNFYRDVKRSKDKSSWNAIDPEISGFVKQDGILTGIQNIKPPVRLSVSPYISAYYDNYDDKQNNISSNTTSFNGGADLKYGLNDAFTLDMILVPDFGQVQSDNHILNLTPFETYYVEQRQFFTEGTELFNKGGLFYSRRIGSTPLRYYDVYNTLEDEDEVIDNPVQAKLLNATKISGRTKGGTGIGFFNAIEGETFATIKNAEGEERKYLTGPATNYNVMVIDQNLKYNSNIAFINTSVLRNSSYYDANVTGTTFQVNNKPNSYGIWGGGAISQKYLKGFDSTDIGYTHRLYAGKTSGNFQFDLGYNYEGDNYNPNDLGYLTNNNTVVYELTTRYNIYEPFWHLTQLTNTVTQAYQRYITPNTFYDYELYAESWGSFRNYLYAGIWTDIFPYTTYDYYEPRVAGRFYAVPHNVNFGGWFTTDYSHRFALDFNGNMRIYAFENRNRINLLIAPRCRVNDRIVLALSFNTNQWPDDVGWVNSNADTIIFGKRNFVSYETIFNVNYTPSTKMAFSFRLRHNWSYAKYVEFYNLGEDGSLNATTYNSFDANGNSTDNVNFNAFNIDFVYTWYFAPGSQMNIVWKNSIYQFGNLLPQNYMDDLSTTFDAPQSNNFSIKILYYLDYLYLKKKM